jgi:hypothetical protein
MGIIGLSAAVQGIMLPPSRYLSVSRSSSCRSSHRPEHLHDAAALVLLIGVYLLQKHKVGRMVAHP